MYGNPYVPNMYGSQNGTQQVPNVMQNFQISPQGHDVIRYANSMEDVQRYMVIGDTPYFSKDMSVVWIKNTKGEIRTYELKEVVPLDEKDMKIEYLQSQIEELKGMITNEPKFNKTSDEHESKQSSESSENKATPNVSNASTNK